VSRQGILACDFRIRLLRRSRMFRAHELGPSFRMRRRVIRNLRGGRRGGRVAQAPHEIQELRSQPLAAQFVREARSLVARGAAAQPFQTVPVTFADFVRPKSRDLTPGEGGAEPMTSLTAFVSVDAPFETSAPGGAGAFSARSSFSTSSLADWAWTPLP
jgi:hypothetical protein